ncbi:MAG: 3-oxoadipate enol-lactonase [Solirubrobacteraceae bacterium]|nr:3-oxoadipate enol-lactonase [Solirubrobacteraceae bacterium]
MPTVQANGVELYYEVHGEGEPLLCVMGLSADTLAWALQVPAWSQAFKTVIFDNRDVGQSGYVDAPYEIRDMAADALALADALELESFHLLGVSMGGMIAQEMALSAPERIRTLTLAVTYANGGRYARTKSRIWGADFARRSQEEIVEDLMLLTMSEEFYENEEGVAFLRQMMLANPHPQRPEGFRRQLEAASAHDSRDRLGALAMPVHIIGAEHDILIPVWKSHELAELIPGSKLSVLPRCPHGLQVERAQEFNDAVLAFVRESAPAAAGA